MATLMYGRTEYRVEKLDEQGGRDAAYLLHGPRGARYALLRNVHNPSMLFTVNDRGFTRGCAFEWVRETNDGLKVVG